MTQDTTASDANPRRLHANLLQVRREPGGHFLLNDEDIRFAADCERMRVDRNGSVLSLLLVRLNRRHAEDVAFFSRVLEGRLRTTDTPGQLNDGRIAILLPDTSASGAWKVAADISEVYPPGPGRPECEVLVYPHSGVTGEAGSARHHDDEGSEPFDSNDGFDPPSDNSENGQKTPAATRPPAGPQPTDEFFFAKSLPLWKRSLDVLGGCVGLLASVPILAVAAAAVKATSPGPAFFQQQREGHGGRRFTMWKLRTMHADAEAQKQDLRKYSQQDGPAFKMRVDPRTTTVGRFLRWTSMDELPQFWNVLKGDMSLVGPRPLPTEESVACEGWQRRRLQVVPGMTCTWQVCERGNVTFDEWVRMDLRYARDHSIWADLRLLFLTIPSLLLQKGMR